MNLLNGRYNVKIGREIGKGAQGCVILVSDTKDNNQEYFKFNYHKYLFIN